MRSTAVTAVSAVLFYFLRYVVVVIDTFISSSQRDLTQFPFVEPAMIALFESRMRDENTHYKSAFKFGLCDLLVSIWVLSIYFYCLHKNLSVSITGRALIFFFLYLYVQTLARLSLLR